MSLFEYLRKDLKLSAKTVISQFTRYLSFAAVLLFISMLIFTVSTLHYNQQSTQRAYLESRYVSYSGEVYHFRMIDLTQDQYLLVQQFLEDQTAGEKVFKIVGGIESTISGTEDKRYDIDIKLLDDIDTSFDVFLKRYSEALDEESTEYTIYQTPLLDFELSAAASTAVFVLLLVMIVAAGVAALWILHSTMINHYKFTYGIYMTYGANFGRLFMTAFWEQFWLVLVTWLPASLIGLLISWLVFRQTGLEFSIHWHSLWWSFLLTLLTVGIAVFISIRAASAKTPTELITAADNSNYISSPRVSNDMVGASFPDSVGRITFRRYRKYILRLMTGVLAFSMLFVSASTVGYCYDRVVALDEPEISVSFTVPNLYNEEEGKDASDYSSYAYDAEKREIISSLPGIKAIAKSGYYQAMTLCSHVRVDRSIPQLFSGGANLGGIAGEDKCFLNVDYHALDDEMIATFETLGYEVEGSLESVLTDSKTVAVTEGFLGAKKFDWKVGDKVKIADLPDAALRARLIGISNGMLTADHDRILSAWLNESAFSYTEYTVGAILSEIPTGQNWGIYFSEQDYKAVTGYVPAYNHLEIYAADDATEEDISFLYRELRDVADYYTNMSVTDLDTATTREMQANKNYSSIITMVSILMLLVCPLIWFFSQTLFYQKRQGELELLQAIGAPNAAIKRYLMGDGFRFALTGGLLFALLAPIVSWLIHRLVGYIMVFAGGMMLASFRLPLIPYLVGLLINIVCGFMSVLFAWMSYRRRRPSIYSDEPTVDPPVQTTENKEASV